MSRIIAVCYAMNYALDHKIKTEKPVVFNYQVDTIEVKHQIDFEHLSSSINISIKELSF